MPIAPIKLVPFYFLRHGETDWNVQGLCQGQADIPLNDEGCKQAHEARQGIKDYQIRSICFSPLLRAKKTAEIVALSCCNASLYPLDDLKERAFGSLEGKSNKLMYRQEESELLEKADPIDDFEPHSVFLERVSRGINLALCHESPVLIVSHGRVFRALCILLGVDPVQQLSYTTLQYCWPSPHGWQITSV